MSANATKSKTTSNSESIEFEKDIKKRKNWFIILLYIIWFPFKIILYPFIWVIREFRQMGRFLANRSNSPLDFEEIALVESVPVFFTFASIDLAIILGIIASIGYSDRVKSFVNSLTNGFESISQIVGIIVDIIRALVTGIYDVVVKVILGGTWSFLTSIKLDPIILLVLAIVLSVGIIAVIMIVSELNVIGRIMRKLGYFGFGIAELPYAIYDSLDHLWMRILKSFGRFIASGEVTTKNRTFYRKIIAIVSVYAIWIFVLGVLILAQQLLDPNFKTQLDLNPNLLYQQMGNLLWVIFLSGILAGTALMYVLSRVLKIVSKDRYNSDKVEIDNIRHKSLIDYLSPKSHVPYLSLSDVARLVDISKSEMGSHFKDKELSDWVLSGNSIVNDQLYKKRIDYVEELVDQGLDDEDDKPLIKAIDYLTFMEKGLRNVDEYVEEINEKKGLINEDIADLRGLYDTAHPQEV